MNDFTKKSFQPTSLLSLLNEGTVIYDLFDNELSTEHRYSLFNWFVVFILQLFLLGIATYNDF